MSSSEIEAGGSSPAPEPRPRQGTSHGVVWAACVAGALVLAVAAFLLGRHVAGRPLEKAAEAKPAAEKDKVLHWTCAMHPYISATAPGLCPICSMPLITVKAEAAEDEEAPLRQLVVSEEAMKLMEIQTSRVERLPVTVQVRMVGKVAYDETRLAYVAAWVPGRIDRLYVNFVGAVVAKGDPLTYLYSPDLRTAQEEFLIAARRAEAAAQGADEDETALAVAARDAARKKLELWGVLPEQVTQLEKTGRSDDHMTIYAPAGGTVVEREAFEGKYVEGGERLFSIADLTTVWVKMDAYERDLKWLRLGQEVSFNAQAYPDDTFVGEVAFIDPFVDPVMRTAKVRVNVPNPEGKLKPEMFVHGIVSVPLDENGGVRDAAAAAEAPGPLVVPASAPLVTGTRAVVYVQVPGARKPTYEGREVVLGPRAGDFYVVRQGLEEGQLVVTNGNFKIDSSLQIQAKPSMMSPEGGAPPPVHAHGAGAEMPAAAVMPGMIEAPAAFMEQLAHLDHAAQAVAAAAAAGPLSEVRDAFEAFGKALGEVDDSGLKGKAGPTWAELRMVMGNDVFEGREARALGDAQRVAGLLAEHAERVRAAFGVGREGMAASAAPVATPEAAPEAFRQQLAGVLDAYLVVHQALAGDDFAAAQSASPKVGAALNAVDMGLLGGEEHMRWMEALPGLRDPIGEMTAASDIEAFRAAFARCSDALTGAVKAFGLPAGRMLYRIHCPMSFEGRGGDWLQADQAVRNPYLGQQMPTCGEVVQSLPSDVRQPQEGHRHE